MAGAGYKLFVTGDVLTAASVNNYLMQQAIMVFANSTARSTALSGVVSQGMVTFLTGTNSLEYYDGSAWQTVSNPGDITGITTGATSGLTGGVTSGTADLKLNTTAKGGLLVGTGAGTVSELAVGTNNYILTADSTQTTGMKWAAAAGGGKVLQVVSATYSTATTIASTSFTDTGLSASITPSATSSKILVLVMQNWSNYAGTNAAYSGIQIVRASTNIYTSSQYGLGGTYANGASAVESRGIAGLSYLDSPSSTSSLTYKTQGKAEFTASSQNVVFQQNSNPSSIILLEIGA